VRRIVVAIAAIALLGSIHAVHHHGIAALHAQEGHPLTGTWTGDWGAAGADRTHVTVVMNWEGKAITGLLNPGPDQAPLTSVTLDPPTWTVRIEADAKDASGRTGHVSAEGKLEDIASYHRTITGTWTQGTAKGTFKLTRD
jgi:hypothetical protein